MIERPPRGPMPVRILGLYALAVMEREGSLHGYALADRISERTRGTWRPGAGAIYPALDSLARRRLAKVAREGTRRVYHITPEGRKLLRNVRRQMAWRLRGGLELGFLWSEIGGVVDPAEYLLQRLDNHLDAVFEFLVRGAASPSAEEHFRHEVRSRIEVAARRLNAGTMGGLAVAVAHGPAARPRARPGRGGHR